jgi:hypothetical protein
MDVSTAIELVGNAIDSTGPCCFRDVAFICLPSMQIGKDTLTGESNYLNELA